MPDSVAERVARGVEWLDEQVADWRSRVNVDTLDMTLPTQCVLGQVFATATREDWCDGYDYAVDVLGMEFPAKHGFDMYAFGPQSWSSKAEYDALQGEWTHLLLNPPQVLQQDADVVSE